VANGLLARAKRPPRKGHKSGHWAPASGGASAYSGDDRHPDEEVSVRRALRRSRRCGKPTLLITAVFLATSLLPRLVPPAHAGVNDPAPPAPVPEDPLGQHPGSETPEISIDVDVRDGHLSVRVVDIWGPGRIPLVVRTYTSTILSPTAVANQWLFNHPSRAIDLGTDAQGKRRWAFHEADGTQSIYKYSTRRVSGTECWNVYVKDIGVYSTMEMHGTLQGTACARMAHASSTCPKA
jgi:hypothetical protein